MKVFTTDVPARRVAYEELDQCGPDQIVSFNLDPDEEETYYGPRYWWNAQVEKDWLTWSRHWQFGSSTGSWELSPYPYNRHKPGRNWFRFEWKCVCEKCVNRDKLYEFEETGDLDLVREHIKKNKLPCFQADALVDDEINYRYGAALLDEYRDIDLEIRRLTDDYDEEKPACGRRLRKGQIHKFAEHVCSRLADRLTLFCFGDI